MVFSFILNMLGMQLSCHKCSDPLTPCWKNIVWFSQEFNQGWRPCSCCEPWRGTSRATLGWSAHHFVRSTSEPAIEAHAVLLGLKTSNRWPLGICSLKGANLFSFNHGLVKYRNDIYFSENNMSQKHGLPNMCFPTPSSARTCLLISLCTCLGGVWSIEQPSGSLAEYYPAFMETIQNIFTCGGPHAVRAPSTCLCIMGSINHEDKIFQFRIQSTTLSSLCNKYSLCRNMHHQTFEQP